MSETENKPPRRSRRKYIFLMAAIAIVIAGWSAAWFYGRSVLADQLDLQLAGLSSNGVDLTCADMTIAGFPFRYEVACADMQSMDRDGTTASVGALNAVALIYNPMHVIFEATSPASVNVPFSGLTGDVTWETARASMKFSQNALGEMDAVIQGPEAAFENPFLAALVSANKAEFHARRMPDTPETLEGYLSVDALSTRSLPKFDEAIDMRTQVQIEGGAPLLAGADLPGLVAANGGELPVRLVLFQASLGESKLSASGDLTLNGNGTLSGKLDLALGNANVLLQKLKPLLPPQDNTVQMLDSLVMSLDAGAPEVDGVRTISLPMAIENGFARIGFLPLGRIPPLFPAGS